MIRWYITARYGVTTLERTTDEIMSDLVRLNLQRAATDEFASFLHGADMVKFAKLRPDAETCGEDMARARKIIESNVEKAA